jgi:hypothetical protein
MLRFVEDADLRKKMGEAARLKVTDLYPIDGYLKKYDMIYRSVLGST